MLESMSLWPVEPSVEQNWSGEGQHVEYKKGDMVKINKLLTVDKPLGSGLVGVVYKVKCGRIFMARKTMHLGRDCTKDEAISEVAHMNRLEHAHIIRVVGTYVWTTEFNILMYPVANGDLGTFLEHMGKTQLKTTPPHPIVHDDAASEEALFDSTQGNAMASSCEGFFSCLSSAMRYIHRNITKHMDIKPKNILVRSRWYNRGGERVEYNSKVYISDFGIARSYETIDAANTDGDTLFTKKYASPEVVRRVECRDLSADIFSLGCVFLEMFAALDSFHAREQPNAQCPESPGGQSNQNSDQISPTFQEELKRLLESSYTGRSYQGIIDPLQEFLRARIQKCEVPLNQTRGTGILSSDILRMVSKMLQFEPQERPSADDLVQEFGERLCCIDGPDELEATDDDLELSPEAHSETLTEGWSSRSIVVGWPEIQHLSSKPGDEEIRFLTSGT